MELQHTYNYGLTLFQLRSGFVNNMLERGVRGSDYDKEAELLL